MAASYPDKARYGQQWRGITRRSALYRPLSQETTYLQRRSEGGWISGEEGFQTVEMSGDFKIRHVYRVSGFESGE